MICDYDELKARYGGYVSSSAADRPKYTGWPKAPTHADLDPLLRDALRAEAERKAAAESFRKKFGRLMRK